MGYLYFKSINEKSIAINDFNLLKNENDLIKSENEKLKIENDHLNENQILLDKNTNELNIRYKYIQEELSKSETLKNDLNNKINELTNENNDLLVKSTKYLSQIESLNQQINELKKIYDDSKNDIINHVKNISNSLLENQTDKLTKMNQLNLSNILTPLSERISSFEKQIEISNKNNLDHSVSLRTEIGKLYNLNVKITQEADNLAKAIKGDNKIQGNWGEHILESILETSGLEKNREYVIQSSFVTDEGKRYQPDVVINLPSQRHIIIDSKVSLINYEQYFNSEGDVKEEQLKKHFVSIKRHIMMLSEKNYQSQYDINGLDFVLMFIPIENAYTLISQYEQSIFTNAYERNVIISSPSTLIATLRTIANVWKVEYQNQNAIKIAQASGALYDKFVGLIEDIKQIGKQIDTTKSSYDSAIKKLSDGKGNLISRVEMIKQLGAKATKSIPELS